MNNHINAVMRAIPEESQDEALSSIISAKIMPPRKALIRCHLTHKFEIAVCARHKGVTLSAERWPTVETTVAGVEAALRRMIHEIDGAMAEGIYRQSTRVSPPISELLDSPPPPPDDMDIPMWDDEKGEWYDAEY